MYLSTYIVIEESEKLAKIYCPSQNTILMVSKGVLLLLNNISQRYGNDEIDVEDNDFITLRSNEIFNILEKHYFFTSEPDRMKKILSAKTPCFRIVYFHVSQECNLRCEYCYAFHNIRRGRIMRLTNAKIYIDKLIAAGASHFILTGGEPLLNPDLNDIVEVLKMYPGITTELLTNGTMLNNNIRILERVDNIIVSLDVGESNKRRGIEKKEILRKLEGLPDDVKNKMSVRSVVSKGEESQVGKMRTDVESIGLRYIAVPRLPNSERDLKYFPELPLTNDNPDTTYQRMTKCGAATYELAIDWNGDIYPCQNLMRREHKLTNLKSENWDKDVADSELSKTLKDANVFNIDKCSTCDYRFLCGGGCRALSYNVYSTYNQCLEFYCEHFQNESIRCLKNIKFSPMQTKWQ